MNPTTIIEYVQNGQTTSDAIAAASGKSRPRVNQVLREAYDDGVLTRHRDGNQYVYEVADADASATVTPGPAQSEVGAQAPAARAQAGPVDADHDHIMPVDRTTDEYDWDRRVIDPDSIADFIPTNGEWDRIKALVAARNRMKTLAHFCLGGPTGCGKTLAAQNVAADIKAAFFEIQMRYSMREKDLIGAPDINSGYWVDGTLTKALLASQERPVVLLIDEANRARPQTKSVLYSVLDDRCRIQIDGPRGGEVIQGDPQNLIVFFTINSGFGHMVEKLDMAEKRRMGRWMPVDYLGIKRPDAERELLMDRTGVDELLADELVDVANDIRRAAADSNNTTIHYGIPTDALITTAADAVVLHEAGVSNPVIAAAQDNIIRKYYSDNENERNEVAQTIKNRLDGSTPDASGAWARDQDVVCHGCGFRLADDKADDQGLLASMQCPNCNGTLDMIDRAD